LVWSSYIDVVEEEEEKEEKVEEEEEEEERGRGREGEERGPGRDGYLSGGELTPPRRMAGACCGPRGRYPGTVLRSGICRHTHNMQAGGGAQDQP